MDSSAACKHEIVPAASCTLCAQEDRPHVYVTGGGTRYHATPHCSALVKGQRRVGTPEPIETAALGSTKVEGRSACRTCKPLAR